MLKALAFTTHLSERGVGGCVRGLSFSLFLLGNLLESERQGHEEPEVFVSAELQMSTYGDTAGTKFSLKYEHRTEKEVR